MAPAHFTTRHVSLIAFLFYYTVIIFTYSPPDYYGANKEIPENIDFSEPLDSLPTITDFENYDLILANYAQPGIYRYYTDYQPKEVKVVNSAAKSMCEWILGVSSFTDINREINKKKAIVT